MNKTEFIQQLAAKTDSSLAEAGRNLQAFIESLTAALEKGETVTLPGFGTFYVSHRAAREGRNPQTGETIKIGPSTSAKFKAGKSLKDLLNKK